MMLFWMCLLAVCLLIILTVWYMYATAEPVKEIIEINRETADRNLLREAEYALHIEEMSARWLKVQAKMEELRANQNKNGDK